MNVDELEPQVKPLGLVDPRGHADFRLRLQMAGFSSAKLDQGDVLFRDAVGEVVLIEYKLLTQFFQDMTSGQMMKQAAAMVEVARFPILLLQGSWVHDSQGGHITQRYTWTQAWNYLQSLQDAGMRLQLSKDLEHSIQRVLELHRYYQKEMHQSTMRRAAGDPKLEALSRIPGLGPAKAKRLLQAVPEPYVSRLSQEGLQEVDGIGPKLARNICEFWK